jgi:hypothetical protein
LRRKRYDRERHGHAPGNGDARGSHFLARCARSR